MTVPGDRPLELAILGCGAVTEEFHLPAAGNSRHMRITLLVDKDLPRARSLAQKFNVPSAADNWTNIESHAEAALVALPHHLHAPVTIDLLKRGVHTLVEKPMALSRRECETMAAQAQASGSVLAVGLVRRFYASFQFVKRALDEGVIGDVTEFDFREGQIYNWPLRSGFRFDKKSAGGGVLVDTGSHVLDALLWWLGDWESVIYYDDAEGGLDANCELHLRLRNGATGTVELSRTRRLRNTFILRGRRGTIDVSAGAKSAVRLRVGDHQVFLEGTAIREGVGPENLHDALRRQLEDFAGAVRHGQPPLVPAAEGMRSVDLIEECYESRRPLALPWDR